MDYSYWPNEYPTLKSFKNMVINQATWYVFSWHNFMCVCLFLGQTTKSNSMTTMKVLHTLCPSDSILKDPFCVCWGSGVGGGSTNGVQWDLTFIDLRISRMYVLGVQWNLLAIVEPTFIQHDIVQILECNECFALGEFNPWKGCNSQNDKRGWIGVGDL